MTADAGQGEHGAGPGGAGASYGTGARYVVDAHLAGAVQVGEGSTQINYSYGGGPTWTDGVVPTPLITWSGQVDSPYRGLSAFSERDAAFFFGRDTVADEIMRRMSQCLHQTGLLIVSGMSGVGKSSLLRAGVLPRLRGAGLSSAPGSSAWPCLVFTPTGAPLAELAVRVAPLARADAAAVRLGLESSPAGFALTARQAALTSAAGDGERPAAEPRLLLVIDQFEQIFTQCSDQRQREAFVQALCAATAGDGDRQSPAALAVLVVRADFEARCADYPGLAAAVQDRYLVTPMTERQLRLAITEPARTAGSMIADDLVEILLRAAGSHGSPLPAAGPGSGDLSRAGVLPLLSHALDQAWRRRAADRVTLADYERTGGIEGAVADSAERAYGHLTSTQQAAARQVFTRLTATSPEGIDVADRVSQADLLAGRSPADAGDVTAVLEEFATARLLTLAAGTVEICHEVLLTAWPLLRDDWLAETRADRIVRTRLRTAAAEWARSSRDESYLYGGTQLAAATATSARMTADRTRHPWLSQHEYDFLRASTRLAHRKARRRRRVMALLTALAVAFAGVAAVAAVSRQEAVRQRDIAAAGQLALKSESSGTTSPRTADLEAVAAWRVDHSIRARYALLAAAARPDIAVFKGTPAPVNPVAFSPNGQVLAQVLAARTARHGRARVRLWNVAAHRPAGRPLISRFAEVQSVVFSPDGRTLATAGGGKGGGNGIVQLWDVASHRLAGPALISRFAGISSVAFSSDGTMLAAGDGAGRVWLWNVATGQPIGHFVYASSSASSLAFSPDGTILAVGGLSGTALWKVPARHLIGRLADRAEQVNSVAFSPDGKTLATGAHGVRLWNVASRHLTGRLTGSKEAVNSVAFRPGGTILAAGESDGTVRLWDVATRRPAGLLSAPTGGVVSVAFSPGGSTLAAGDDDGTVRLWNLATVVPGRLLTVRAGGVRSVAITAHGRTIAAGAGHGDVLLWNVASGRPAGRLAAGDPGPVNSVAVSSRGAILAAGYGDGKVRLWDAATSQPIAGPLADASQPVYSVVVSPDGGTLAAGPFLAGHSATTIVRLWDVASRRPIGRLEAPPDGFAEMAFSPDGRMLAIGGGAGADLLTGITQTGVVRLWDIATRHLIGRLTASAGGVDAVAFSPDGQTIATGDGDRTVRLWDVATRHQIGSPLAARGAVSSVAFSPDGATLAAGDASGTVQLWDVATRREIGSPLTAQGRVTSVAFSPDGATLAVGDTAGPVQLWDVSYLTNVLSRVCDLAAGSFTRAEWTKYVPSGPAYRKLCP